jgi:sarcosine oxidase gamma subunit
LSIKKERISMFDRGSFWSPMPHWPQVSIDSAGHSIRSPQSAALMCLVSGNLDSFLKRQALDRCLGPRDVCDGRRYALRLAPDRMLFVVDAPLPEAAAAEFGWSSDGIAVTNVTDGFLCFDLTGPRAGDIMRLAAPYDFGALSSTAAESTLMQFAGAKAAMVRLETGWRLHVERPMATAVWRWLENVS